MCRVDRADPFAWPQALPSPAAGLKQGQQQAVAWEVLLPEHSQPSASAAQVRFQDAHTELKVDCAVCEPQVLTGLSWNVRELFLWFRVYISSGQQ